MDRFKKNATAVIFGVMACLAMSPICLAQSSVVVEDPIGIVASIGVFVQALALALIAVFGLRFGMLVISYVWGAMSSSKNRA